MKKGFKFVLVLSAMVCIIAVMTLVSIVAIDTLGTSKREADALSKVEQIERTIKDYDALKDKVTELEETKTDLEDRIVVIESSEIGDLTNIQEQLARIDIDEIEGDISDIATDVDGIKNTIQDIVGDLAQAKSDLNSAKSDINAINNSLDNIIDTQLVAVNNSITGLASRVGALETMLEGYSDFTSKVNTLVTDMDTAKQAITDLETAKTNILTRLSTLENDTTAMDEIESIKDELEDIDAAITSINNKLTSAIDDIEDCQGDITELQTALSTANGRIDTAITDINKAKTDITSIETKLDTLEGRIEDVEESIEDIEEKIEENKTAIADNLSKINANKTAIADLEERIETLEDSEEIEELQGQIDELEEEIEALQTAIDGHTAQIKALEDKLDDMADADELAAKRASEIVAEYYTNLDTSLSTEIYEYIRTMAYYHAFYILRSQSRSQVIQRYDDAVEALDALLGIEGYKLKFVLLFDNLDEEDYSTENWKEILSIKEELLQLLEEAENEEDLPDFDEYLDKVNEVAVGFMAFAGDVRYGSIEEAVLLANDGDEIEICEGAEVIELSQSLVINKNLTIIGNGARIVMTAQPAVMGDASFGADRPIKPIIAITGSVKVEIKDITLDGNKIGSQTGVYVADDAEAALNNVTIQNLRRETGEQHGWGVLVDGIGAKATVVNSDISGFTKGGLYCVRGELIVDNVTITGEGHDAIAAENGIWYFAGTSGEVKNVHLKDINYAGDSTTATGIYIDSGSEATVDIETITYENVEAPFNIKKDGGRYIRIEGDKALVLTANGLAIGATTTIELSEKDYEIGRSLILIQNAKLIGNGARIVMTAQPAVMGDASFGTGRPIKPIIAITGSVNVEVKDIILDGDKIGSQTGVYVADDAKATLNNVTIQNLRRETGEQHGWGVLVDGVGAKATVTNSNISGFTKGGLYCVRGTLDVDNVKITGDGHNAIAAENGIWYFAGTNGTVKNVQLKDINYVGDSTTATGIYIDSGSEATVDIETITYENVEAPFNIKKDGGRYIRIEGSKALVLLANGLAIGATTTIELSEKDYEIGRSLILDENAKLIGNGARIVMTAQPAVMGDASFGADRPIKPIIAITGSVKVEIKDITLDGNKIGSQTGVYVADDAEAALNNVTIQNLRRETGEQHGWGVLVDGIGAKATVVNSDISGFTKGGLYCVRGELIVDNVTITGEGHDAIAAENGIWYFAGTSGEVKNVHLKDINYAGDSTSATGIYIDSGSDATVELETITYENVEAPFNIKKDGGRYIKVEGSKALDKNLSALYTAAQGITTIELGEGEYRLNPQVTANPDGTEHRYYIARDFKLVGAGLDKTKICFVGSLGFYFYNVDASIEGVDIGFSQFGGGVLVEFDAKYDNTKIFSAVDCVFLAAKGALVIRGGTATIDKCVFNSFDTSEEPVAMINLVQLDFGCAATITNSRFNGNDLSTGKQGDADSYIYGILVLRGAVIANISDCEFDSKLTVGINLTNRYDESAATNEIHPVLADHFINNNTFNCERKIEFDDKNQA